MTGDKAPHTITVEATIHAGVEQVWSMYTRPEHITQWNFASPEWHCPAATNELEPGGKFVWRMEAKDGSMGFDFSGRYEEIRHHERIVGRIDDERSIITSLVERDGLTHISQTFEIEDQNSAEQQRAGWQAILDNFSAYAQRQQ